MSARARIDYEQLSDLERARCILTGDAGAALLVTQRSNQRLFRVAWSILRSRPEAEDAVQSGYLKAFAAMGSFQGAASLSTWLTRIVINEALERRRRRNREIELAGESVVMIDEYRDKLMRGSSPPLADGSIAREQIRQLLEQAIARLPNDFRLAFVLCEIEGSSIEDAAEILGIPAATVKTRRLRARRRLQQDLGPELRATLQGTFPFAGADCEAMSERVIDQFYTASREP